MMSDRPNVLLITADQLRCDALGCYGNDVCRTPNLDGLARSGVLFENSFTPNPICVPARATITTGNYSHRATGTKNNSGLIRDDQPKLAEHFAACGYETYACGKLHYVPYAPPPGPRLLHGFQHCDLTESGRMLRQFDPAGKRRGVEDYVDYLRDVGWGGFSRAHGIGNNDVRPCPSPLPPEHHVDHWVADRTIRRMKEHAPGQGDKPFLIWCSFPKPHSPYDPPAGFAGMYDPRDVPPPAGDETMLAGRDPALDARRYTHAFETLSPEARRVIKAYYYALITHQDAQVGRVLAALDEAGAADNTIVVYTADHGDMMGDFGTYFKACQQQGSVRAPLLLRAPRMPAGARRGQLAGLQDVLPTLAALTGCPLRHDVHGTDLTPAMLDDAAPGRELFYAQSVEPPRQTAMVTDGRWKYAYAQQGAVEELYDLGEDPHELANLAAGSGSEALVAPWRDRLIAEARRLGDTAILDGASPTGLAAAPAPDRAAFRDLPVSGMGWRWY